MSKILGAVGKKVVDLKSYFVASYVAYLIVRYVSAINFVEQATPSPRIVSGLILLIPILIMGLRSVAGRPFGLFPRQLQPLFLYLVFLFVSLFILNLNSLRPVYSISRSTIAVLELGILSALGWQVLRTIAFGAGDRGRIVSWGLTVTMASLLVGQLLIPEWNSGIGGIRMSGGTNPNQVGFFSFLGVFWAHYNALRTGNWRKIDVMLYVFSAAVMVWSLSRTVLFGWGIMYAFYFLYILFEKLSYLVVGRVRGRSVRYIFVTLIFLVPLSGYLISQTDYLQLAINAQQVEQRLSGSEGLESRLKAWQRLWPYFERAPATGAAGWWNSTNLLPYQTPGRATSPHNLYIRLLSEVGLFGLVAVLLYPLIVSVSLVASTFSIFKTSNKKYKDIFVFSAIMSVFVSQFFEDRYMVGVLSLNNSIVIFIVTIGLYNIVGGKRQ